MSSTCDVIVMPLSGPAGESMVSSGISAWLGQRDYIVAEAWRFSHTNVILIRLKHANGMEIQQLANLLAGIARVFGETDEQDAMVEYNGES